MELESLVQIVGRSLVQLQSMTQTASFEKLGSLWWFRNSTSQNVLLTNQAITPSQVKSSARDVGIVGRIVIHQFLLPDTDEVDLVQQYANQGFCLDSRQYLMRLILVPRPTLPSSWTVCRAENMQQVSRVSSVAKQKLLTKQQLPPEQGVRLYAVEHLNRVIAWGRITQLQPETAWVSDLFTKPKFRKRGVMTALMHECNRDALAYGALQMLLFSSETNHDHYHKMGYETVAVKLRFVQQPSLFARLTRTVKATIKRVLLRAEAR